MSFYLILSRVKVGNEGNTNGISDYLSCMFKSLSSSPSQSDSPYYIFTPCMVLDLCLAVISVLLFTNMKYYHYVFIKCNEKYLRLFS